jgi:hypothetical protein
VIQEYAVVQNQVSVDQLLATIVVGGTYEHYKGKLHKILYVSRNVDDLSWWVVYESLYDNKVSKIWHRKLEDFLEVGVWQEGMKARPRFVLVQDK